MRCTLGRVQAGEEEDNEDERRAVKGREKDDNSDMSAMDVRRQEERAGGKMRGGKAVDEDSTPNEVDDDDNDVDIGASLDGGLMAGGRLERWKDLFDHFGVDNVDAICTDSPLAHVTASKLLAKEELKYSRITWLPCAVHVCNLLLSGIAKDGTNEKIGKGEDTIIKARAVVRFIREHGAAPSLYQQYSAARPSSASVAAPSSSTAPAPAHRRGRELAYPAQTRLATHYLMLERLLDRRRALEALMVNDDWLRTAWRSSIFLQAKWLAKFHIREGDWTYDGGVDGDKDAASCRGEKETSQVGQGWVQHGDGVPLVQTYSIHLTHTWTCVAPAERNWTVHERVQVKRRNRLGFIKLTRLVEISTNLRLIRCQGRGSGYVLPWEDDEEEAEEALPPPRDEGVRPDDRVTKAQHDQHMQRGQRDRLSKASPNVETYFGCCVTVLMPIEQDSVYDPESDPMVQDSIEAEPWSDPDDLAVESEHGGSDEDRDDAPLTELTPPRTHGFTTAFASPPPPPRPLTPRDVPLRGPEDQVGGMILPPPTDRREHGKQGSGGNVEEDDDEGDDVRGGYEGSSKDDDDPGYSPTRPRDDDDEGADGMQPAGVLRRSDRRRDDQWSGAGTGGSGAGVGVAGHVGGAGRAGGGQTRGWCSVCTERMLETGDGEGHRTAKDAKVECSGVVGGEAGDGPPSPVQGVCVLPSAGALSAGELEWHVRQEPLRTDRRGRMDEASRRAMAGVLAYVSCNPSVPSSTTYVIPPTHVEGPGLTLNPTSAPGEESLSPKSQKKEMRVGKSLSTVRRGGVKAAIQGGIHAPDTAHGPVGSTGDGDGITGVAPQRKRKDIVDNDDV
ncbi:hypothetical protein CBR_g4650 [Chara braunii]|uniref:DUF659 domain-containing protein n=1 Tax=Chara braunii TaxID=69332 RepID=A0A388KIE0_CHABU|nr:hypothetical protein CBR_g4650 [Chara braunii]|eukprot:GBG69821.1 hypothetical protein CBR_g4650 [Chara braunii]